VENQPAFIGIFENLCQPSDDGNSGDIG